MNVIWASLLGAGLWLAAWAAPNVAIAQNTQASDVAAEAAAGDHAYTNRLINSHNPYLLLHAHNRVDWRPWGAEAIAKAKQENKPIFLSIGYSTCYWCQVAEKTLYSDPEIAKLMNQWFVNIKVDREQRSDVDQVYMLARIILTGAGGWPNNLFLTPDLKPFYAGSYFPPADDASGRPGFPAVLSAMNQAWVVQRDRVFRVADEVYAVMQLAQKEFTGGDRVPIEPSEWLARGRKFLLRGFDAEYGGLFVAGNETKFPHAPTLELLLTDYRINKNHESLETLTKTLDAMAYGGLFDHLAGGFHRYSTERTWSVPHFEKMLYDNAQIPPLYAEAYRATSNALYRHVAIRIGEFLSREMMSPEGGFYTALDSRVNGEEAPAIGGAPRKLKPFSGRNFRTGFSLSTV